jgi:hypothetical protein
LLYHFQCGCFVTRECDESMPTFDKPKWRPRGELKNSGRKFFSKELNSNANKLCPFSYKTF